MNYHLYTDGATSNNGSKNASGGWAWALFEDRDLLRMNSGYVSQATNNICEMKAIIEGCTYAQLIKGKNDTVTVYSDSAYCINCFSQKWYKNWEKNGWKNSKKEPVKNQELWKKLIPFFEDETFIFQKVKGHADCEGNILVDKMAVEAKINGSSNYTSI